MKIKFNADDNLPLNKPLKLHLLTIIVRSIFKDGKFYLQLYLDNCLYELRIANDLWMLEYNKIGISEGIDVKKTNGSK